MCVEIVNVYDLFGWSSFVFFFRFGVFGLCTKEYVVSGRVHIIGYFGYRDARLSLCFYLIGDFSSCIQLNLMIMVLGEKACIGEQECRVGSML